MITASRRGFALLARLRSVGKSRRRRASFPALTTSPLRNDLHTNLGGTRFMISPAQAAAHRVRSTAWRCVSCGKVHAYPIPVRVAMASPCTCGQIEFEPRFAGSRIQYTARQRT
ncbi:MAG: hypothetical protein ABI281_07125 [Caldimonas sp.]